MYGIDLNKMLDDIRIRQNKLHGNHKPFIIFIIDDIKEKKFILDALNKLYGDYIMDKDTYVFNDFIVDIRSITITTDYRKNLVAMHCEVMFYIYTKFNRYILAELLPCLNRHGKFIAISKELTGNKLTCNEIVNDIIKTREEDITEIEWLLKTWNEIKKYKQ